MGKDLLPIIAGVGLAAATGGLGAGASGALGAAGGTGAAGAGAAGALGAGNALAAQGAAGLLGGAGATAAGYGAGAGALGATGGAGAMGGLDNAATATFGPNNEFTGQTIASELTANPYTGGFDSLNGLERAGQRVSGFLDEGGMDTLGKFKNSFGGQQEQTQQAQNTEVSGGAVAQQEPQPQGQMPNVYGQPAIQLTDEQKRRLLAQGLL